MGYWEENPPPMSFVPEGWSYERKREFRFKTIPYLPKAAGFDQWCGKTVLCIGDGAGIDAVEFARHGALVSVFDISRQAIDLSLKHAVEAGVKFICAEICDITNPPRICDVDLVYSFGVFHHIPAEPYTKSSTKALNEVHRALRPGGTFMGMVYNRDSLLYSYSILRRAQREGITPERAMQLYSERNEGCPYSVAYTSEEWTQRLWQFKNIIITPQYNVIDLPGWRKVPIECPPELGWHLFFTAEKP